MTIAIGSKPLVTRQGCLTWLDTHPIEFDRFCRRNYHPDDVAAIKAEIRADPIVGYAAIRDSVIDNVAKQKKVSDYMYGGSKIILIVGGRGSGKTCFGHWSSRQYQKQGGKRKIFMVGPPMHVDPNFKHSFNVFKTPTDSVSHLDEGALLANARKASKDSNIQLTSVLPTLRHVDKTIFVYTQNTALLDLNFIRFCDGIVFKEPSMMQMATERQDLFGNAIRFFSVQDNTEAFFWCPSFMTKFTHGKDEGWNDALSKCYRAIESIEEANAYAKALHEQAYSVEEIQTLLLVKQFERPEEYYEELLGINDKKMTLRRFMFAIQKKLAAEGIHRPTSWYDDIFKNKKEDATT